MLSNGTPTARTRRAAEEQRHRQTGPTKAHRPARPGSARPDACVAGPAAGRVLHQEQRKQHSTRTEASDAAAGPLKVERYC